MKHLISAVFIRTLSIATLALVAVSGQAADAARQRLIHPLDARYAAPVPHQLRFARYLGAISPQRSLRLNIHLAYPNADAVHDFTDVVSNPRSPVWGRFLTPKQFVANFAPSQAAYDRVRAVLQRGGLRIARLSPNRKSFKSSHPRQMSNVFSPRASLGSNSMAACISPTSSPRCSRRNCAAPLWR